MAAGSHVKSTSYFAVTIVNKLFTKILYGVHNF
nr:MAG TPA: hypothetical protein [Caudoviricetes sp.]